MPKKFRCHKCFKSKTKEQTIEVVDHLSQFGRLKKYICKDCFKTYNKVKVVDVSKFVKKKKKKKKIRKTQTVW